MNEHEQAVIEAAKAWRVRYEKDWKHGDNYKMEMAELNLNLYACLVRLEEHEQATTEQEATQPSDRRTTD